MKKIYFLVALMVLVAVPLALQAQDSKKILELKNQIIALQNKGKLDFKDFTLCSKILGFGSYVPVPSGKFKKGSKLFVYYEPLNVFTNHVGDQYKIWYKQDMIVLSGDGKKTIYEKLDALNFQYTSKTPVLDLYATNSLELGDLPAGKYQYKAVLKDSYGNKTATKVVPFEITEK